MISIETLGNIKDLVDEWLDENNNLVSKMGDPFRRTRDEWKQFDMVSNVRKEIETELVRLENERRKGGET